MARKKTRKRNARMQLSLREVKTYLFSDRISFILIAAILLLNACLWVFLLIKIDDPDSLRVITYSVYFGVTDYGPASRLLEIPLIGFVVAMTNILLGYLLYNRNHTFAYILLGVTVFLEVLVLVPAIAIYFFQPGF